MRLLSIVSLICIAISSRSQTSLPSKVNASDFEKQLSVPGIQLLDVRTSTEFQSGHISKAMLADWNDIVQFKDRVRYIDKNKPVYIYCLAGVRSTAAATWMRQNGYTKVVELDGGINAWKKTGKLVEGLPAEKQLTPEAFQSSIPANETVLVDIGAEWCPPCKIMQPVIDSLQNDKNLHLKVIPIDAGIHTDLLKSLQVTAIPVFIIYRKGQPIWRKEGITTIEEIKAALQ